MTREDLRKFITFFNHSGFEITNKRYQSVIHTTEQLIDAFLKEKPQHSTPPDWDGLAAKFKEKIEFDILSSYDTVDEFVDFLRIQNISNPTELSTEIPQNISGAWLAPLPMPSGQTDCNTDMISGVKEMEDGEIKKYLKSRGHRPSLMLIEDFKRFQSILLGKEGKLG